MPRRKINCKVIEYSTVAFKYKTGSIDFQLNEQQKG